MSNPDYINFMNSNLEPHLIPSDSHVSCQNCHQRGYVSEEEMEFLKQSRNITNNEIVQPFVSEVDGKVIVNTYVTEYIYASSFCPKCEREKFGEHSNWRDD